MIDCLEVESVGPGGTSVNIYSGSKFTRVQISDNFAIKSDLMQLNGPTHYCALPIIQNTHPHNSPIPLPLPLLPFEQFFL